MLRDDIAHQNYDADNKELKLTKRGQRQLASLTPVSGGPIRQAVVLSFAS